MVTKILMLEDSAIDAELIQRLLLKGKLNCKYSLAVNKDTYLLALEQFQPDIILSDHSLPQLNSVDALEIARQRFPDIPFIIVTGTVSEEYAAKMIKIGMDDYILKDRMARLPVAITSAINQKKNEKEKREARQKIIQSEINLRTILENTSEGFLLLDNDTIIRAFNGKAKEYILLTIAKEFQIGQSIFEFIEDSRKDFFEKNIKRALKGEIIQYDRSFEMENGNIAWVDFSLTPVIEAGEVKGICITGRDITEKKIIEQEREFDRNNLKALINNTNDLMWSLDRNFKLITSNEAFDKMIKTMSGKIVTKGNDILASGFNKEQLNRFRRYYERVFSGESFTETEYTHFNDDFWSEISFYPIYNGYTVIGAACFSRDISQSKKTEEQLKKSEKKYRSIFLNSPLPKWLYDCETLQFLEVNDAAVLHYGYTREEFLGMTLKDIRPKEDVELFLNDLSKLDINLDLRNGNWRHLKKNGDIITVETTAHQIDYNNTKARMVIANDITEKIKSEEYLRQSEMRLNEAQAIAHISNWEIDLLQNIHTWSNEFYNIYGLNKAEVQPSTELFLSHIHPDDKDFAQKNVHDAFVTFKNSSFDFRFLRKDGVIRHGYTEWKFEFDKKGTPIRLFGILQDTTERKEAEENLRLLEEKILEQKIEEQKKIARAIIEAQEEERNHLGQELHDNINQILATTRLYLGMAANKNEELKELVKFPMELIDSSMEEIRLLCHKQVTPLKNLDLEMMITDILNNLNNNTTIKTEFSYSVPDGLLPDDLKLNIYRIIQEQINNIVKHAAAKKITIIIQTVEKWISIVVQDDGRGFDVAKKGKGIGISNMINRIQAFNGEMTIESSPGNGCKIVQLVPY